MLSCCAFTTDNLASDGFSENKAENNEIKKAFQVHAGGGLSFLQSKYAQLMGMCAQAGWACLLTILHNLTMFYRCSQCESK